MLSRRRRLRAFALVWGVLQLILPVLVLFGDATVAKAGSLRPSHHVESSSGGNCGPVHTDDCVLCRFLSHSAAPTTGNNVAPTLTVEAQAPTTPQRVAPSTAHWQLPGTRAPPTV